MFLPRMKLDTSDLFDPNTFLFTKFFGEPNTVWKCSNENCKDPVKITTQELELLDKEDMVSWEKLGPLERLVFALCHHCGSSLSQTYIPMKNKRNRKHSKSTGTTAANDTTASIMH